MTARLIGRILCAAWAALSLPAIAQPPPSDQVPLALEGTPSPVTPQEEHLRRVNRAQEIEALDENLFGDSINAYTGSAQFSVTDVFIPGNSALPVAVARRFDVNSVRARGQMARSRDVFEDWDLDIPHMHGVFAATTGWQAGSTPNLRCAQPIQVLAAPPSVSGYQPDDYWQGNHLYVPGQGDDEILHLAATATDKPTDGLGYQWVTKGLWYFSCLPTTANGVAGDAFLARDPEGNKYWFNQIVEKLHAPLFRGTSTPIARREIVILPTRIEDRFGNWVNYTYSSTSPRNLLIIEANDGRRIDLTYSTEGGPSGRVSSLSVGARTWTYGYAGPVTVGRLSTVTRPDGSAFSYDFATFHEDHVDVSFTGCGIAPQFVYAQDFVATITHPSGAVGTFTFAYKRHGRTYVPQNCWIASNDSGDRYPPIFTSLSLTRKEIGGTGLPQALQWQLAYPTLTWGYTSQCTPSCATTKAIDTTQPDSSVLRQTFGIRYGENDGILLSSEVVSGAVSLRRTAFDHRYDPTGQPYLAQPGAPFRYYNDASTGVFKPRIAHSTTQQGATFNWTVNATGGVYSFDRFARPLQWTASSSHGYTASQAQTYFDQTAQWVLGLPATSVVNGTTASQTDYYATSALPQHEYRFGQKRRSFTYRADSTIETIADNLGKTTTLSSWKRGVPQSVSFADGIARSAIADDNGWVTSITDEVAGTTNYQYDTLGRITNIVYPVDPSNTWAPTARTFAKSTAVEYGLPVGTWKQTIATGGYRKHLWFDALWRPILEREWDNADATGTQRFVRRTFGWRNNEVFKSYALSALTTLGDAATGTSRAYDALNRLTSESTSSELATSSTTNYQYLDPFETRVTNPRGFETRLRYFALDEPTMAFPVRVERAANGVAAEQSLTEITRDVWGKVLSMQRSGNGASATRGFVYDTEQRLCQLTEPESGALVMAYDAGGNLAWSAEGRTAAADCAAARSGVAAADRIVRSYDLRNRLSAVDYPDTAGIPRSDLGFSYAADGAVLTATAGEAGRIYTYNSLRRLENEELAFGSKSYFADWQYDTQGAVSGLVYPNGETVVFQPNALGQHTRSGSLVTGASYHPSGANAGWTFGNGIARSMTQTTRRLPDRLRDAGTAVVFDEDYDYDASANIEKITDARDALQTRTLTYDAQDRLATAQGPWGSGTLSYDGADNLKTQVLGAKNYTYNYSQQKLSNITDAGGATLIGFTYDGRGNQTQKGNQALTWDIANRVAIAPGKARYRYDAHGRRVLIEKLTPAGVATGEDTVQFYGKDGALLYEERSGVTAPDPGLILADSFEDFGTPPTGAVAKTTYHYLGKTLVARKDTSSTGASSTIYLHTDVLGSVIAETNASQTVVRRTSYQPFGLSAGSIVDGPNFTGHVLDTATGLVYMQGRYYDPDIGRFLSMDPSAPSVADGEDFNRYAYVRNNPYRAVDPDGQVVETLWDVANIGIGVVSLGKNVATGNFGGAAVDAVGIVVDTIAAVAPGVPGGAGTAIKVARAGENLSDAASSSKSAEKAADLATATKSDGPKVSDRPPGPDGKSGSTGGPGAGKRFPPESPDARAAKEGVPCRYCDQPTTNKPGQPNSRERDHIDPRSRDGNNTKENEGDSCRTCNREKGPRNPDEWPPT
jgi:RHS repeat-associated protein